MGKSGNPLQEKQKRKVRRLDDEVVESVCPLCEGVGSLPLNGPSYDHTRWTCERCDGLGVIYAEE